MIDDVPFPSGEVPDDNALAGGGRGPPGRGVGGPAGPDSESQQETGAYHPDAASFHAGHENILRLTGLFQCGPGFSPSFPASSRTNFCFSGEAARASQFQKTTPRDGGFKASFRAALNSPADTSRSV